MSKKYVDADDLVSYCQKRKDKYFCETEKKFSLPEVYEECIDILNSSQAERVKEEKRGYWKKDQYGARFCSNCGQYPSNDGKCHVCDDEMMTWNTDFCPHCGAEMEQMGQIKSGKGQK